MIKTAIFVEGQTELVFVREYLLKRFDYQNISLECYTLFTDSDFRPTEYRFPNESATHYFQIMNVGNDNAVLSRLLSREQYLWNVGFQQIIGLRDMYSKQYREEVRNAIIDDTLNQSFIEGSRATIDKRAKMPHKIHFHYAIMEAEAWILGCMVVLRAWMRASRLIIFNPNWVLICKNWTQKQLFFILLNKWKRFINWLAQNTIKVKVILKPL